MSTTIKFPLYIIADTQSQLDNAVSFARQMLGFPRADLFTVRQLPKDEDVFEQDYQTLIQLKQVHGTKRAIISIGDELIGEACLFAQIRLSSKIDDLDEAIRPIQSIIGQEDGGLASHYFDRISDSWNLIDEKERERWIIRYIGFELECFEKMEVA